MKKAFLFIFSRLAIPLFGMAIHKNTTSGGLKLNSDFYSGHCDINIE